MNKICFARGGGSDECHNGCSGSECKKLEHAKHAVAALEQKDLVLSPEQESHALQVSQTKSLEVLSKGVADIAAFLTGGGLNQLLSGYAKSQASTAILGGLASHDGRDALDARVLGQNSIEIVEQILRVHDKFHSRLSEEKRDPEIKDAEKDLKDWSDV